jgi:GYF domain 2
MNTWPKWFPYPISWIRGFALTYTLVVLVKYQFPLQHSDNLLVILVGAWATVTFLFTFLHWVVGSVAKSILKNLPTHPKLGLVRQYLTDRWSGSVQLHWREGLNAFMVSLIAFLVSVYAVAYLFPIPSELSELNAYGELGEVYLRQSVILLRFHMIPIGMLIVSPYLYQYDLWVRHRRAARSVTKVRTQEPTKKRSPKATPDPIDMELNQLRTEAGMTRVKTGKRSAPSVPENPEWYVFRSGKAEGPYTKLQLLEIQKITDRTKVRRGETEWQRASEIPDLAAYLTEK